MVVPCHLFELLPPCYLLLQYCFVEEEEVVVVVNQPDRRISEESN